MPLIPIQDILQDPELGAVPFKVTRQTWKRAQGKPEFVSQQIFSGVGCIHPAQPDELAQFPEEYRHADVIVLFSTLNLSMGENFGARYTLADQIEYTGSRYRVIKVKNWLHLGYFQAWAVRISDSEAFSA